MKWAEDTSLCLGLEPSSPHPFPAQWLNKEDLAGGAWGLQGPPVPNCHSLSWNEVHDKHPLLAFSHQDSWHHLMWPLEVLVLTVPQAQILLQPKEVKSWVGAQLSCENPHLGRNSCCTPWPSPLCGAPCLPAGTFRLNELKYTTGRVGAMIPGSAPHA